MKVGIRREDKSPWEARIPLVPEHVRALTSGGVPIHVQPSGQRVVGEAELRAAGAEVTEDLSGCGVILGVKEIPLEVFERRKTYVFFSHTIKGQAYNMPMLRRMMELECSLIDYERIVDD
jgi:alpha-aminoadipic semialdehyde synthase